MKKVIILFNILLGGFILSSCSLINSFIKYRVTFVNEGEIHLQYEVSKESKLDEPTDLSKTGYRLTGWYKDLDDETTKWNFAVDKVMGHLELHALWELRDDYLIVENILLEGAIITWNSIEGATFEVDFLGEKTYVSGAQYDLSRVKTLINGDKEISIKPVKEGFTGLAATRKVKYQKAEEIEAYNLDFEELGTDFLNASSFKTGEIASEEHNLAVAEGRLTNTKEEPKSGSKALIFKQGGFLELREKYSNFLKLEFNLGSYKNNSTTSKMAVLVADDNSEWQEIASYAVTETGFTKITISMNDLGSITLPEELSFKFIPIMNNDNTDNRLIIDDIVISAMTEEKYDLFDDKSVALSDYYKTAEGLKGKELVEELRIIVSTNLVGIRYSDIKEILEFADVNLTDSNKVLTIYDGGTAKANWGKSSEWHREHVWPNSRLGMERVKESGINQASDPHNLRAIIPSINSSRSNRYYVNKTGNDTLGHTIGSSTYYPGDDDRGDVARILMYMVVRYEFLNLTDNKTLLGRDAYKPESAYMGLLSILLDWHQNDPVNDFEKNRNEVIYTYQKNRNPFIDHPELFAEVFAYFSGVDNSRKIAVYDYYVVEVNYSDFKKRNNLQ